MHYQRHRQLAPEEAARIAADIVTAKIGNYLAWVRESSGAVHLAERLDRLLAAAAKVSDVDVLRGLEGDAARHLFRWVNDHVREPEFASPQREPRRKADPWNSLLDFAYTRLFTRLNVLLRNRGLNPYLGWLHSAGDDFESLVCDLQEPFRARCDRWALRLVNRGQVRSDDFAPHSYGGLRLTSRAIGRLLEIWEREMDTRVATDPGTFEQLLHAQADAVLAWVNGAPHLRLFRAPGHRVPAAWNPRVGQAT
jgi:CRISPR-associated protein Cas1